MSIRIAGEEDFAGIRRIWEERFTTDSKYLDTLFSRIMPYCRSYIYCENGNVLSAISLMPMLFTGFQHNNCSSGNQSGNKTEGWYMFGVATLCHAERRKLAQSVIKKAIEELRTENYGFIFERPANQSLNKYYLNLGFSISLSKEPLQFNNIPYEEILLSQKEKTVQEIVSRKVLQKISESFEKKFIWADNRILEGLIALGELRDHVLNYKETTPADETYIAINPLNTADTSVFRNTFFCFPME